LRGGASRRRSGRESRFSRMASQRRTGARATLHGSSPREAPGAASSPRPCPARGACAHPHECGRLFIPALRPLPLLLARGSAFKPRADLRWWTRSVFRLPDLFFETRPAYAVDPGDRHRSPFPATPQFSVSAGRRLRVSAWSAPTPIARRMGERIEHGAVKPFRSQRCSERDRALIGLIDLTPAVAEARPTTCAISPLVRANESSSVAARTPETAAQLGRDSTARRTVRTAVLKSSIRPNLMSILSVRSARRATTR
jgi:hypothetical protein